MKILVGGGSGFIGRHLRRLAEGQGHEVVNITRKSTNPNDLTWTLLERYGLPPGVDGVVNLAGKNIMTPTRWTADFKKALIDSRVNTTRILVESVNSAKVKPSVFIGCSAVGYYGTEDRGSAVDEDSPPVSEFVSDLCQQWEAAAQVDDPDVRSVIVRVGLAMGKDGGMLASMYWPFFFGVGGVIGDGQQWFPWIHVDDVAGIMLHAINDTNVHGVLNAVAPETATNGHFTNALSTSMRRYAPFPVPKCLLSLTLGNQRADMMTSSPKILPTRTLASGYSFKYSSLQAACDDCVKWG